MNYQLKKTNMKEKFYVKPQAKMIEIEASVILAGSNGDSKSGQLQNYQGEEWSDN